jgi:hypothetical protein
MYAISPSACKWSVQLSFKFSGENIYYPYIVFIAVLLSNTHCKLLHDLNMDPQLDSGGPSTCYYQ